MRSALCFNFPNSAFPIPNSIASNLKPISAKRMSVCVGAGLWLYINRGALWLTIPYFKLLFIAQKDTPVPAGHHFIHGFQMVLTWKSDLPGTLTSWSNIVFMEIIFRFEGQSIWGSNLKIWYSYKGQREIARIFSVASMAITFSSSSVRFSFGPLR